MQLQLNVEIEETLSAEASALGISASELSAQILAGHAADWELRKANGKRLRRAEQIYEAISMDS